MALESSKNIDDAEDRNAQEQVAEQVAVEETIPQSAAGKIAGLFKAVTSHDDTSRRFLLRVVQPGLAGLMDGSVSTLAPIFATAFATHRPFTAFLIGIAAATRGG